MSQPSRVGRRISPRSLAGHERLPVRFDVHVFKRYFDNPKYSVFYSDYRGSISIKDEYFESEYVKNFGLAYNKKKS